MFSHLHARFLDIYVNIWMRIAVTVFAGSSALSGLTVNMPTLLNRTWWRSLQTGWARLRHGGKLATATLLDDMALLDIIVKRYTIRLEFGYFVLTEINKSLKPEFDNVCFSLRIDQNNHRNMLWRNTFKNKQNRVEGLQKLQQGYFYQKHQSDTAWRELQSISK